MKKYGGKSVGFDAVTLKDGFWKEIQDLGRAVTMDAVYDRFEETGRFASLKCDWKEGMPFKPHIFWDSDITKWMEGAAYYLKKQRDPALEEKIDTLVSWMEANQGEDGYQNTYFTTVEPDAKFTRRTDHELYCAGHLVEGALAYYDATGKRNMLDMAIRYIDLIDRVFRVDHSAAFDTPGHQEIELALVKLYKFTGEERYKKLAEYFIDTRGNSEKDVPYAEADMANMQSHLPVREQKTAEGHSVRAVYQMCGMADLALLNQEEEMTQACETLFENITQKRMHITGGLGTTHLGESFTIDYDLPEYRTYNETCASIAMALFCRRMWLIDADGKYADCAERSLYNTVLSGISLSGDRFFYENPIAADPKITECYAKRPAGISQHMPILERVKVFNCSCCPPNLVRTMGSIGDYMYSTSENMIFAHCYMHADAAITLGDQEVVLHQKTAYPYEGEITIETETAGDYTIAVRIPAWSQTWTLSVNGIKLTGDCAEGTAMAGESPAAEIKQEKGYVYITRTWTAGDVLTLDLDMSAQLVEANPQASSLCGRVAVTRGPIVYCAEGIDNDNVSLRDIRISPQAEFSCTMEDICGRKLPVLRTQAAIRKGYADLYRPYRAGKNQTEMQEITLTLIPYMAWANRGVTEMNTWFLVS